MSMTDSNPVKGKAEPLLFILIPTPSIKSPTGRRSSVLLTESAL